MSNNWKSKYRFMAVHFGAIRDNFESEIWSADQRDAEPVVNLIQNGLSFSEIGACTSALY